MNRSLTLVFAAYEALLVVGIGIAIPLAPLTIMWAFHFGFAIDWIVFWRAAVDIWLVGHGVDLAVTLEPTTAAGLGLPGAEAPFAIRIAALGFALGTILLGVRAGRRIAETRFRFLGELVSIGTFALLSFGATASALYPLARPSLVQGALLPALVFAIGVAIGSFRAERQKVDGQVDPGSSVRDWIADWPSEVRTIVAHSLRAGAASVALVVTVSAIVLAVSLGASFAEAIASYESLHTEVLGGLVLTLGQLAFLPNAIVFTAAWLCGPGFALGTGSMVSPIATALGPVPAIPILAAIPATDSAFGLVGIVVPIVAGFLTAVVVRARVREALDHRTRSLVIAAAASGLVAGLIMTALAIAAGGAAGPGRLADVGPNPLVLGLVVALEVGLGAAIGFVASRTRTPASAARTDG